MRIALDYDKTYNASPSFWDDFISLAHNYGHEVNIVTVRHPEIDNIKLYHGDDFEADGIPVIYTDGVAKRWAVETQKGLPKFDIWIDDKPETIIENSRATLPQLEEWRANGRV